MSQQKNRRIRFPIKLDEAVQAYADERGLTFSHVVRQATANYLLGQNIPLDGPIHLSGRPDAQTQEARRQHSTESFEKQR